MPEIRDGGPVWRHPKETSFANSLLKGRTRRDFRRFGLTARELLDGGAVPRCMMEAGFTVRELLDADVTVRELLYDGATVDDFRRCGIKVPELFDLAERGSGRIDLTRIVGCYGMGRVLKAPNLGTLPRIYSLKEIQSAGIPVGAVAGGDDIASLLKAGFSPYHIWESGFSTADLRDAGTSIIAMKDGGIPLPEIRRAFPSVPDFSAAGFTISEMREAGFSPADLAASGIDAKRMVKAGFVLDDLRDLYPREELVGAGFCPEEIRA